MMKSKGFTMLEMLIVLSIVALLFTITLPNIQKRMNSVREKGCSALIEVVNTSILQYELDTGEVVDSIDTLVEEGYLKESQTKCMDGTEITISDGQAER
ncbi:MAG: prepilin-type N-terminal cleavage/methylation domain-containing protein [Erysipelotrichales bacterium]|nr:prepilin-type N-terminal cleavage/methylation domain-containing protein [Erysipelotrichales bacterium]